MSRVGKKPVALPNGVKAVFTNGVITIQGAKGKLDFKVDPMFNIEIKDNKVTVVPVGGLRDKAKYGLIRALIQNMVVGVTNGYSKELEIRGVGFKAQIAGKKLTLNLGYSHPIVYETPDGITIQTPKPTNIVVSGIDKAKVGEVAAVLRKFYLPEPYKGKGVRYVNEYVRHKAGKTVA